MDEKLYKLIKENLKTLFHELETKPYFRNPEIFNNLVVKFNSILNDDELNISFLNDVLYFIENEALFDKVGSSYYILKTFFDEDIVI